MRHLRGSRLDLFGLAHVRRVERELVQEYRGALTQAMDRLTDANAQTVLDLAELPDLVRGYEQVKLRSVETYRARMAELRADLDRVVAPQA
jgi:indolepyruvate ferredoxin oxidoreductase